MELPHALRIAVDRALSGVPTDKLSAAAEALSRRYRDERRDGRFHVATRQDALAYVATRLPATYAALRAAFAATAEVCPAFAPKTALDVGSGPGTALWAAPDCWSDLAEFTLLEASPAFVTLGKELAVEAALPSHAWRAIDLVAERIDGTPQDLVTAAYVLNELAPAARPRVIEELWRVTTQMLIIVEPGTPAGWQRILDARRQLIDLGGHVVAPCPHDRECPLQPPDWCHFSQRVARSRLHRLAKGAEVPWEDEKFSYVAISRAASTGTASRVIAHPRKASGHVTLKLCQPDGTASNEVFSRREGEAYKRARRCHWGSLI
jgi:ribosomal protein RSM22 (predicted rRNA methylase)